MNESYDKRAVCDAARGRIRREPQGAGSHSSIGLPSGSCSLAKRPLGYFSGSTFTSMLDFCSCAIMASKLRTRKFTIHANHFDVVPVRTNDESCVVVRVVVRAQTRRTIVFSTRLPSLAIEGFDLPAILSRERQVKMRRLLLGLVQAQ